MLKKIANNAYVFSLIAKVFSVISGIVYSILYSRYLGAELRGTASIINNYADILSIILSFADLLLGFNSISFSLATITLLLISL